MAITYDGATEEIRQIIHHHAVLRRGLERRVGTLCDAAGSGAPIQQPLAELREYLQTEILPHAVAEEGTLYQAAATRARAGELVRTMTAEHRDLAGLIDRLQPASGAAGVAGVAAVAEWIATLFAGHAAKENDLLLPALAGSGADLAALLADMRHSLAGAQA